MFNKISIDKVRDYWNNRPCNIRHSPHPVGSMEWSEEVGKRKYFVEPHIPEFASFNLWSGKKVLEIGCGIGTDTISFVRTGALVTAVDLSDKSLELAKKRIELYGLGDRVTFYRVNCEKLSEIVPVEKYDLIYSFGVIHHTPNPEKALDEIKKYMGPGSILKIMVYNKLSWKVFWIWAVYGNFCLLKDLDGLIARYSEAQTGCPVTYSYTLGSVRKLLKGFRIIDIRIDHIFPYEVEAYKKYQYKKVCYFRILPEFLFRWIEKRFGWHMCIDCKL